MRLPSLIEVLIEDMKAGANPDLSTCVFLASGITKRRGLERNQRKIPQLTKKIFKHNRYNDPFEVLEDMSSYFQDLDIKEEEFRTQHVLDSIISDKNPATGESLTLVQIFNMVAQNMGIKGLGAYRCKAGNGDFYFSRYFGYSQDEGLSFPVRNLTVDDYTEKMKTKKAIYNKDLVVSLADRTADLYLKDDKSRLKRMKKFAKYINRKGPNFL
jgi:hypothetical protein